MWTMPGWAVPMLTKALGSSDTVKRHYAAKTLENVLAQSAAFGPKFATQVGSWAPPLVVVVDTDSPHPAAAAVCAVLCTGDRWCSAGPRAAQPRSRAPVYRSIGAHTRVPPRAAPARACVGARRRGAELHRRWRAVDCAPTPARALRHRWRRDVLVACLGVALPVVSRVRCAVCGAWQAAVNVLNLVLWSQGGAGGDAASAPLRSLRRQLLRSAPRTLLAYLLRIVERAPATHVCAKAMLSLALLIEQDGSHNAHRPLLVQCGEKRLPAVLDRVAGRRADLKHHV